MISFKTWAVTTPGVACEVRNLEAQLVDLDVLAPIIDNRLQQPCTINFGKGGKGGKWRGGARRRIGLEPVGPRVTRARGLRPVVVFAATAAAAAVDTVDKSAVDLTVAVYRCRCCCQRVEL